MMALFHVIPALAALALLSLLSATPALAVMPPHVSSTEPPDGGTLTSETYVIHGWSLGLVDAASELRVVDAETQAPVVYNAEVDCEWEGTGDMPGARQQRCTIKVHLEGLEPGRAYEVSFFDEVLRFTYQP